VGARGAEGVEGALGIELVQSGPQGGLARMPVDGNTQRHGRLHGGATMALGETIGSVAAAAHALSLGKAAVGIEISGTHHRGVRTGWVTAKATAIHLGRRLATYEVAVLDDADHLVSTIRFTALIIDPSDA
jgi:uncharacterized protein (TIGR00369 family)